MRSLTWFVWASMLMMQFAPALAQHAPEPPAPGGRFLQSMDFLRNSTGTAPAPLPRAPNPYIAPVMQHDSEFDSNSIPLSEWLAAEEVEQIPWKVDVKDAALRMDQRLEVAYTAKIQGKDLNKVGSAHELFFLSGISDPDGKWMTSPKVVRETFQDELPEIEIRFSDAVFIQPGDYLLWLILYDRENDKHNVEKRRIEVSEIDNDPLPDSNPNLPQVEFPRLSDREGGSVLEFYGALTLPVTNRQRVRVELISVLSAPEQHSGRQAIIRSHNQDTFAALNTLSRMQLAQGTMSLTGLDILHRKTPFQQSDYDRLDWTGLAESFRKIDNNTVSAAALQAKGGAAFFRSAVREQLAGPSDALRVFIVVSSSLVFGHGADREEMKIRGDCHCRVYHLRFRHGLNDVFDDLERVIKPLRPKIFNLSTPRDLRKAIAEIIKDLESL